MGIYTSQAHAATTKTTTTYWSNGVVGQRDHVVLHSRSNNHAQDEHILHFHAPRVWWMWVETRQLSVSCCDHSWRFHEANNRANGCWVHDQVKDHVHTAASRHLSTVLASHKEPPIAIGVPHEVGLCGGPIDGPVKEWASDIRYQVGIHLHQFVSSD